MDVCAAVYQLLSTNAPLAALVGLDAQSRPKVYAKPAPQGTATPYVVYEEVDGVLQPVIVTDAPRLWQSRIQLMAVADDYATARQLLRAAVAACNYARGTIAGVTICSTVHDAIGADDFDVGTQQVYKSGDLMVTYLDDGS